MQPETTELRPRWRPPSGTRAGPYIPLYGMFDQRIQSFGFPPFGGASAPRLASVSLLSLPGGRDGHQRTQGLSFRADVHVDPCDPARHVAVQPPPDGGNVSAALKIMTDPGALQG